MSAFSKIGKVIAKVDPLRGGDRIAESVGLPSMTGEGDKNILDMGATAANKAAQEANAAQAAALASQQAADAERTKNEGLLRDMNKNYAADLSQENRTQILAGGSADISAGDEETRRKKASGGLASSLGINV